MRLFLALLTSLLLAACGFQLRGSVDLPWTTLHLGLSENDPLYHQIRRAIEAGSQTRIVGDAQAAQASLVVLQNLPSKSILSLSGKGLVREFQLTRSFVYRIVDAQGGERVPASQIIIQREMTFDDERIYAKEAEEALIVKEMERDLVVQLLRRLNAASRTIKR